MYKEKHAAKGMTAHAFKIFYPTMVRLIELCNINPPLFAMFKRGPDGGGLSTIL